MVVMMDLEQNLFPSTASFGTLVCFPRTQRYVRKCFFELLGSIILSACLVWGL